MKDRLKQGTVQPRKPYRRPEVKRVRLKPEEAVLGGCKVASFGGPVMTCFNVTACSVLAS
jgi:hypothetical protein